MLKVIIRVLVLATILVAVILFSIELLVLPGAALSDTIVTVGLLLFFVIVLPAVGFITSTVEIVKKYALTQPKGTSKTRWMTRVGWQYWIAGTSRMHIWALYFAAATSIIAIQLIFQPPQSLLFSAGPLAFLTCVISITTFIAGEGVLSSSKAELKTTE